MTIQHNLQQIHSRISNACARAGRDPSTVRLIAVSKIKPATLIAEASAAGQCIFGESYVQELVDKSKQIDTEVEWHFIGALQSNKVKYLPGRVAMIHSVDRLSLAEEIDRQWRKAALPPIAVLIQVNIGQEASKAGTEESALEDLVRRVAALPFLRVRGLMALPPWCDDPEEVRPYFQRLRQLSEHLRSLDIAGVEMKELSMGMSHDFEVAIEEGATLVRVGTAIFGERD